MKKKTNRYRTDRTRRRRVKKFFRTVFPVCLAVVLIFFLSAAFAHSYYALLGASWPKVEKIEILGINHIDRTEVLNVMAVPRGANLFTVRVPQIAWRLESIPWLLSSVVRVDLSGKIVVEINEREPLAIIHTSDFFFIDERGRLFLKAQPAEHPDSLLVTGLGDEDLVAGDRLQDDAFDALQALLAALQKVRDWLPPQSISECHWSDADGFTLYTIQGSIPIHLGEEDFGDKLARLDRIFGVLVERQRLNSVTRIDLDYSNRAYIEGHFPAPKGI